MTFDLPSDGKEDQIDMSPMIDMVFLLIIFFITNSKEYQDAKVEVKLPIAAHANVPKEPKNRQSITIEANGNIRLGAVEAKLEDIKPTIEQAIKTIPNLKIFLRAEGTVAHDQVRKVMAECAAGGVADIIFATYEKDEG